MPEKTCALWYRRHHEDAYALCTDEADAAGLAYAIIDNGSGWPVGVQHADGRLVPMERWTFYAEYALKMQEQERAASVRTPAPTRVVREPFEGVRLVEVPATAPAWLGKTNPL